MRLKAPRFRPPRFRPLHACLCLASLALVPLLLAGCAQQRTVPAQPEPGPAPQAAVEPARPPVDIQRVPQIGVQPEPPPARPSANLIPQGVHDPVVVGLLLPLSGPHAALGQAMMDAAFLAVAELAGPNLVLLPRDTQGTNEGARLAAAEALAQGAELILGPLFRDAVLGAADSARPRQVPVVGFSTDSTIAGNGVYLMGFTPGEQVERVVRFAADQGMTSFAALAPNSAYGYTVVQALREVTSAAGLYLAAVQFYGADGDGAEDAVKALRNTGVPFQALLLPEGGQVLRQVAPFLPYYDFDEIRLLGTGLWDDPSLLRENALKGGWFAAPSPSFANDFQRRYKEAYGVEPPRIASLAYDAAAIAAVLAASGSRFDVRILDNRSGFSGSDGIFRFRASGVAERGLAVLELSPDGLKVVDPAPLSFEGMRPSLRPGS